MDAQEPTSNDELLRAAVSGDLDAYTELFEGYRPELIRHVSRILHSSDEADDVVLEKFEDAYKTIQGYDPSKLDLKAYLHTVVKNEAYEVAKRRRREGPIPIIDDNDNDFFDENLGLWKGREAIDDDFAKDDRKSFNEEAREARKEGDKQKLDKLRDELRRRMREIKKPDSEDEEDG